MNRIREFRMNMGISMTEAAARLGMPYTTYVNYEKGVREPKQEVLLALASKAQAMTLEEVLHLKTGVNYLENNNMLVSGEFVTKAEFAKFNRIEIPEEEAYAANCIWVNDTVIVPDGYPAVEAAVRSLGYRVILVDTSEYRKLDGGLSCLSLRF